MGKIDYIELKETLSCFKVHDKLLSELSQMIKAYGNSTKFVSVLLTRLRFLKEYGHNAPRYHEEFEILKHNKAMYSMHISVKGFNGRILYSFLDDNTILLHGFYKRGGKKQSDYNTAVKIANKRLQEMKEENEI